MSHELFQTELNTIEAAALRAEKTGNSVCLDARQVRAFLHACREAERLGADVDRLTLEAAVLRDRIAEMEKSNA